LEAEAQAQACECPVVCTDIEASREIVKDKLNGLINEDIFVLNIEIIDNEKSHKEIEI